MATRRTVVRSGGARRSRRGLAGLLVLVFTAGMLGTAPAANHLMKIREVYGGGPGAPNAQFVELQMYFCCQTLLSGTRVVVYSPSDAVLGSFTFGGNVTNGADQAFILIGTADAQSVFGVAPDLAMTPVIPASGGKVCFENPYPVDCMAWGTYPAGALATGTPFNASEGLVPGASAERKISGGINPAALDSSDDTNDSAADFRLAGPAPRNNAGTTGSACCTAGFEFDGYSVEETAGSATITVVRNTTDGSLSVDFSTANGTANAGLDYTATSGTLTFAPGETSKTFSVPILADAVDEIDETVVLNLRNLTSGVYSRPTAILKIKGNILPPSAPQNLTAAAGPGNGQITLNWSPPPSDGGAAVSAYRIYRGTSPTNPIFLTSVLASQLTYTDSGLGSGVTRYYAVSAVNIAGEGPRSNVAGATTLVTSPPSPPRNLRAEFAALGQIKLTWLAPLLPNGPITNYKIYRGTSSGGETFLVQVGPTLTYTDSGCYLVGMTVCYYQVTAVNTAGESLRSNEASQIGTRVI